MTIPDPSSHPEWDQVLWIHMKTGHRYTILYHGLQEASLEPVVIYTLHDEDGPVWVRPAKEFFDGRFVPNRTYVEYSGSGELQINTEMLNDR